MNALSSWQLIYHLSGLTLLGITEQEPLGTLPVAIRTAVLKTVEQIQPDAIELILNQKSPLSYADGQYNYDYLSSWIQEISNEVLRASLEILLGRIYETIPRMRYQMLFNQLEYANSHKENICRRIVIRSIFDYVENLVNKNYRCGFCDVCNPNLKFEADTANILLEEAEIDDISKQINQILEEFDRRNIIEVLNKTIDRGAVAGLFARVTNVLERSPTNLSALYLAGTLARQRKGRETIAFDYLNFGFHEGIKQGYQNDNILMFYQEAALIYPEQAFDWLIQRGGRWDNKEGFMFLFQEAENKFGIDSIQYHALMLLWQIRKLNEISDEVVRVKPVISDIRQAFASKF